MKILKGNYSIFQKYEKLTQKAMIIWNFLKTEEESVRLCALAKKFAWQHLRRYNGKIHLIFFFVSQ